MELIKSKTEKYEQWLNILLWFLLIAYPWIMNPMGSHYFRIPKAIFFTAAMLGIIVVLFLVRNLKINWKKDSPILIFGGIVLLSGIFAENKLDAFFGMWGRYEGVWTITLYLILFFTARQYLVIKKHYLDLLSVSICLLGIYGIFQYFYLDPLMDNYAIKYHGQAFATIGNRNFFALLLCLFTPFAIGRYFYNGGWLNFFFALIGFSSLISTLTRGTWLAFLVTLVLGLILGWKFIRVKLRLLYLTIACAAMVVFLNVGRENQLSQRLAETQMVENDVSFTTGSGRIKIWSMSISVMKAYPILGVGPENFKHKLKTEFKSEHDEWVRQKGNNVDRAHNDYFQVAINSGIFALLLYLFILGKQYIRLLVNHKNKIAFLALCCLAAYSMAISLNISVIGVAPLFWILLGFSSKIENLQKLDAST